MSKSRHRSESGKNQSSKGLTKKQATRNAIPIWLGVALAVLMIGIVAFFSLRVQSAVSQRPAVSNDQPQVLEAVDEITVDQAFQKYQSGIFLLDVREPDEWLDYHVPNTTHIPLGELESRLDELPQNQEIVVVCRSGNRSQEGRDILRNAGFSQVSSMAGGLKEWRASGYPIVNGP